jgi:MFS family permease
VNELAGPYLAGLVVLAVAALATLVWLRPDPRDVGRKMAAKHPEPAAHSGPARPIYQILRTPAISIAVLAMAFGQMVMVMIMVITSPYMLAHQHNLTDISIVISAHTFGMFAFSFVAGRLTDRWGRGRVILTGAVLLILGCALAPISPDLLPLSLALFLLGLGWNFSFVGGSALLSDYLSPAERARTQGVNDLLMGLTTAAASLGSGLIFAFTSFAVMAVVGIALALVPLGLALWWLVTRRELAGAWV